MKALVGAVLASLFAAVCLPVMPAWAQQGAQPGPLFTLPGGSVFELDASVSSTEVSIPILASSELQKTDALQPPELFSVALGNRHDGAFAQALTVEYAPAQDTRRPTDLKVKVNLDTLVDPGTYTVVVGTRVVREVETTNAAGEKSKQKDEVLRTLSFQLTRPAATVTASLSPNSIEHEVGFSADSVKLPLSLDLKEMTRHSKVTRLEIDGAELSTEAKQPAEPPALFLPAGGLKTVSLVLTRPGKVGTTTGKLLIRSPQLSATVEVPYEVILRRPRWHIILTIFLGLLFGYTVRVLLKRRIEDGAARSESVRQRRKLQEEQARYMDEDYRAALGRILDALVAEEQRSAADMKAALTKANADFTAAQLDLTARTQAAVTLGEALKKLAGERFYSLPAAMAQAINAALAAVEDAQKRVSVDPKGAQGSLEKAKNSLLKSLSQGAQDWKLALTTALATLQEANLPWPASMADTLSTGVEEVKSTLSDLPSDGQPVAPEQLLQSIHLSVEKTRLFCAGLWSSLSPVAKEVLDTLGTARQEPASLEVLQKVLGAVEARWTGDTDPEELVKALPEDVRLLLTALSTAIRMNTLSAAKAQTDQLLAQRDYVKAATQAISEQTLLGATDEEKAPSVFDFLSSLRAVLPRIEKQSFASPEPRALIPLEQLEARTLKQLLLDHLLQTLLVGLALCFGAYIIFEKNFVGTLSDYAALLFWAFGTDVTVEALNVLAAPNKKLVSP